MVFESIFDLIQGIPENLIDQLYGKDNLTNSLDIQTSKESYWACKAVFQSLSSFSKNIVLRLIFLETNISDNDYQDWIKHDIMYDHLKESFIELTKLSILKKINSHEYVFNKYFRENLIRALSDTNDPWQDGLDKLKSDKHTPSIPQLDHYSDVKWENLLRYLVGAVQLDEPVLDETNDPSASSNINQAHQQLQQFTIKAIRTFLVATHLMSNHPYQNNNNSNLSSRNSGADNEKQLKITAKGYEYMLKGRLQQVWVYVSAIISKTGSGLNEAISLLFMLSFCELGRSYPMDSLTKLQKQLIFELSLVGIIYLRNVKSSRFYPTFTAISLLTVRSSSQIMSSTENGKTNRLSSSSSSKLSNSSYLDRINIRKDFSIIVETNSQVVAYTNSDLDLAMLSLFVEVQLRMPNMVYGRITRERAKEAYAMGLRASQIVGFLVDHAHPLLLSRPKVDNSNSIISNANTTNNIMRMTGTISNSIVPQNITDLLLLWEAENYRIHSEDCLLFTLGEVRGMSLQNYQSIIEYMQRVDCLLWEHTPSRIMAVTLSGAKLLQSYAEETLGLFSY